MSPQTRETIRRLPLTIIITIIMYTIETAQLGRKSTPVCVVFKAGTDICNIYISAIP